MCVLTKISTRFGYAEKRKRDQILIRKRTERAKAKTNEDKAYNIR